jgi:hypothetical protein
VGRLAIAVVVVGLIGAVVALAVSRTVGVALVGVAALVGVVLFSDRDDGGPVHPPRGTYG